MFVEWAERFEESVRQSRVISGSLQGAVGHNDSHALNKVSSQRYPVNKKPSASTHNHAHSKIVCYSCGNTGHYKSDPTCPARGQKCNKCGGVGHFKKRCKAKKPQKKFHQQVRHLAGGDNDEGGHHAGDSSYAFTITAVGPSDSTMDIELGGVVVPVIVDSGATCNVTDRRQWERMKAEGIVCRSALEERTIYSYGNPKPLEIAGVFYTTVRHNDHELDNVEFVVIEGQGQTLLGRQTSEKLGILQIGPAPVIGNIQNDIDNLKVKYPQCFEGFGKLKDFQLTVPIDPDIEPVVQFFETNTVQHERQA